MLSGSTLSLVFILFNVFIVKAIPNNQTTREKRLFSFFQVVTFDNGDCPATNGVRGVCYTTNECVTRGGTTSLTCASGYGVCCIFSLSSGGISSENNTYLRESSGTAPGSTYTICKSAPDICRIRLDFTTFSISGPATVDAGAIGDCVTDQFSITAPGSRGSPVICGFNTGQHLIVDASDQCHVASFSLSTTPAATRSWDIKVTQFTCSQEVGGPAGCLQFFMGVSGTISNFNFPASMTVSAETTHLSNQHYKLCIRRESGYCSICYAPFSSVAESDVEFTFGLSADPAGMGCLTDYLVIPAGVDTKMDGDLEATDMSNAQRICGTVFSIDEPTSVSICGYCSIQYTEASSTISPAFELYDADFIIPGDPIKAKIDATTCPAVVQFGSTATGSGSHCGGVLNTVFDSNTPRSVIGTSSPFRVTTIFGDMVDEPDSPLAGYQLQYAQIPCSDFDSNF